MSRGRVMSVTGPTEKLTRKRTVSETAKVAVVGLVVFILAGLLWGWWRPVTTGTVTDSGDAVAVTGGAGAAVTAFGSFVIVTGVLAALFGGWAFARAPRLRGIGGMVLVVLVALAGAAVFLLFGNHLADALHGSGSDADLTAGAELSIVEKVSGGVGLVVAPAAALVVYWACVLFSPDRFFERRTH
jgi:hypothetical protein